MASDRFNYMLDARFRREELVILCPIIPKNINEEIDFPKRYKPTI